MTLSEKILTNIVNGFSTEYIKCESKSGEIIKIRISNHCANVRNNFDSDFTEISFVSSLDRKDENHRISNEFLINSEGNEIFWNEEETGESIKSILNDFEIEDLNIY